MSGTGGSPSYRLSPSITNGFGLASLIVGTASFCTPMAGGLAAIALGFLGLRRSKQTHTGKGMSIAGMVLGVASILVWTIFWSAVLTFRHIGNAARNSLFVEPPRLAVEEFLRDIAGNNLSRAASASNVSAYGIESFHDHVKDLGLVQSVEMRRKVTHDQERLGVHARR
jgi:hypothetical protein